MTTISRLPAALIILGVVLTIAWVAVLILVPLHMLQLV